jgi:hypothetical protein
MIPVVSTRWRDCPYAGAFEVDLVSLSRRLLGELDVVCGFRKIRSPNHSSRRRAPISAPRRVETEKSQKTVS